MTPGELRELSLEMTTQDNRATAHPLYCVYVKEKYHGVDGDYTDEYDWLDEEGQIVDLAQYGLTEEQAEEQELPVKTYFVKMTRFINAHFTMKAAKLYIKENKHNLTNPFVYVSSLNRCHEMIKIQKYLVGLYE
jgi:hypothetical protein